MEEKKIYMVPGYDLNKDKDVKLFGSLFLDATHAKPANTPMSIYFCTKYWQHGMQYAASVLSYPTCKGFFCKAFMCNVYVAPAIVRDKEEIQKRELKFKEAMHPWMTNFDGRWEDAKKELTDLFESLKLDFGKATNQDLYIWLGELLPKYSRMYEIHFEVLFACNSCYMLLASMLKEMLGISSSSPEFLKLLRGFDSKVHQVNKKLWEFGVKAEKSGLKSIFTDSKPEEIITKLEGTEDGREWLKEFRQFIEAEGWWPLRLMEINSPSWIGVPSIPLGIIKENIMKGVGYNLPQIRERLAKEREEATAALIAKVPQNVRAELEKIINIAGKSSIISEDHNIYCEYHFHALMYFGFEEIGRRLAEGGVIDEADDVFFLIPEEIQEAILIPDMGHDLRDIVQGRRAIWEEAGKNIPPPFFTRRADFEEAVALDLIPSMDPINMPIVVGDLPVVKPELNADLYGVCGSPGEIEGIARVITRYEDMDEIQVGDILVVPFTDSNWTPIFSRITGVIADRGGALSHAAVIGREFGIPVVLNTFTGTEKIKTGQRVRINADDGAVYILDNTR